MIPQQMIKDGLMMGRDARERPSSYYLTKGPKLASLPTGPSQSKLLLL